MEVSPLLSTAPYRGTRDFLPAEMSVRQEVFGRLHAAIERFGYQRYDGPLLEPAEIYEIKSGQEIGNLQLYTLVDQGNRRLAIRPEMTPSVARMIAANADTLQFPVRWYCNVNCHRYERPQRGRVREHWQINVDIFGSDSVRCELEIFEVIHAMLAAVGARRDMYVIRANDRVLLDAMLTDIVGISPQHLRPVASIIDRWEKYDAEELRVEAERLGVTAAQFDALSKVLTSGEGLLDRLPAGVLERSQLAALLKIAPPGLIAFDPMIVRGFDYYTSTVFEVFDTSPENRRALFGGGRYSDLASLFTSRTIPGIGFGMGDVTLFDFMRTHGLLPEPKSAFDVAVVAVTSDMTALADDVARMVRGSGYRTVTALDSRRLGKEIQRADKSGARVVVIVGGDEWAAGKVAVRDLAAGIQKTVSLTDVTAELAAIISPVT